MTRTSKLFKINNGDKLFVRLSDAEEIERELEQWKRATNLFRIAFAAHETKDESLAEECFIDAINYFYSLTKPEPKK